jgi:hypothetical protein
MLVKILIALVVVLVLFVVMVALRPSEFRVTRSAAIAAPPDAVFAQVNDLHNWEAWSPWAKLDPAAKTKYEGPPAGIGAKFGWSGNNKIGAGQMTITESKPYDLVKFRLDFVKPFKGTNAAEFTFRPDGNQTVVTWSTMGEYSFIPKAVGLFINCDKMMGDQFEKGLAQMKSLTEMAVSK